MGKQSRRKSRDLRSKRHVKVFDAAQVIQMAERWAGLASAQRPPAAPRLAPDDRLAAEVARCMLGEWQQTQVVLRVDAEFLGALLDSDTSAELVPDWLSRLPFESVAVSLPEPMSLWDGHHMCHYVGFIATGIRTEKSSHPAPRDWVDKKNRDKVSPAWTRYGPLSEGDGIRFLWLYTADGDPSPRCQTVSVLLRGEYANAETVADVIEFQRTMTREFGLPWGEELDTLIPLSTQLILYLSAAEPDLDWVPPEQMSRPNQLRRAKVANVGWRVGGALRKWRRAPAAGSETKEARAGGWRLPPHIRRAHWHRVRVATRDPSGHIVGNRYGEHGVDWDYQMRWFPPAPVNVNDEVKVPPTVRDLPAE